MEELYFCFWLKSGIGIAKNRFLCMSLFKQQEKANVHAIIIHIIFPIAQLNKTKTDNSKKPSTLKLKIGVDSHELMQLYLCFLLFN